MNSKQAQAGADEQVDDETAFEWENFGYFESKDVERIIRPLDNEQEISLADAIREFGDEVMNNEGPLAFNILDSLVKQK